MAAEPTYPEDAPVGGAAGKKDAADEADTRKPKAEKPAAEQIDAEKSAEAKRGRQIVTGAAIGVGSAALVAALLYANRSRGAKKREDR
ncbi:hypothetical protein [Sphingosinicella sp. CPCC 101087]|uniref:hypothetical protein n=1 Tax=Sphingosinicella sp. CPCC 101087 TaxID=2497754 RepID=UPI00101CE564|nr:hypothetical protein [Sphingosinicella sp. CPCC 101087]